MEPFNMSGSNYTVVETTMILDKTAEEDESYKDFFLKARFITGLVCYPIVCFLGLTGNMLTIIVLSHDKVMTSTNVLLTVMAVADSLKLLNDVLYFLTILLLDVDMPNGTRMYGYLYPYAHYLFNMSVCTTAWLTVAVAAERYIMVCHATRARDIITIRRARILSAVIFISMATFAIPFALRYRTVETIDHEKGLVTMDVKVTKLWQNSMFANAYIWVNNLLRSIIPLIILCTFNYFIIKVLKRSKSIKKKMTTRHRITIMLMSVIIVFMVCVTPDAIMSTVFGFGYYEANYLVRGIREITDLLLAINSAVNFILYCTFNKVFWNNFLALFRKRSYGVRALFEEGLFNRSSFRNIRESFTKRRQSKKDALCENL